MYGRFLKEAASIAGESRLADVGDAMQSIGDSWQEVAQIFKQASETASQVSTLPHAAARMQVIADQEQATWEILRGIVGE